MYWEENNMVHNSKMKTIGKGLLSCCNCACGFSYYLYSNQGHSIFFGE